MQTAKLIFALVTVSLLAVPAQATPVDDRAAALAGADNLLDVQNADGSMPWIVGNPTPYQNVQGLTGMGFLEAYKLSLDASYLGNETSGAQGVRDWLVEYLDANPGTFLSSSNAFFLAEYATLTGETGDMDNARAAFRNAVAAYGDADGLVDAVLQTRLDQGHTNLGVWDVALFIRAANDLGHTTLADDMADRLIHTDIVDIWDNQTTWYEIGLAGVLFGLGESDFVAHKQTVDRAADALLATTSNCDSGSFSLMYRGTLYCDDVQMEAYGVIGLAQAMRLTDIGDHCALLRDAQGELGGFDLGGYQIAEVTSEAVMALSLCAAPHNTAVTSYSDVYKTPLYALV